MATIDITTRGAVPGAPADETTDAIQGAISGMASGDTLLIPHDNSFNIAARGIAPKSNTIIQLDGTLQQITNPNEDFCRLIKLTDRVSAVTIQGNGTLRGDRNTHVGNNDWPGARGACVELSVGANNIVLKQFSAINSWADGIIFEPAGYPIEKPFNVAIDGIVCNDNRRNGLSVINGDTISVRNCQFRRNGKGARPSPPYIGIDLECSTVDQVCQNIVIERNVFDNNGHQTSDGNVSVGSPNGTYKNIFISGTNVYDWRYQPIIVTGKGGNLGTSPQAAILRAVFSWWSGYRYWGYKSEWRSV